MIKNHDRLLFEVAFPNTSDEWNNANEQLRLIAESVAKSRGKERDSFLNSGISGSRIRAPFSLALNTWLVERYGSAVKLLIDKAARKRLVELLSFTLDPVEQEMLHAGKLSWPYWSNTITGRNAHDLTSWVLEAFNQLPGSTQTREYVFQQLGLDTEWHMRSDAPTLTTARIYSPIELQPKNSKPTLTIPDALLLGEPTRIAIKTDEQQRLADIARGVLCAQLRETDPSTYANIGEVMLFDMGGGIRIALYAMNAEMKMSLQSFIGYLAFKNGVPIAYGGGWVLNKESGFGVNIFPPFRGGGSTVIVCQLLRLYHFVFQSTSFSVDPYQIGYGNEDGIKSGSFWFYYRLGFRPEEKDLATLAEAEAKKIQQNKEYRSDATVLRELAVSTMRWRKPRAQRSVLVNTDAVADSVTAHIAEHFHGDRSLANKQAFRRIRKITAKKFAASHYAQRISVLLLASGYLVPSNKKQIRKFIDVYRVKSTDEVDYVRQSQDFPDLFLALNKQSDKR